MTAPREASGDTAVGFAPVSHSTARVLILGSMPGRRSLADAAYYAHPQNAFWRIVGAVAGFDPSLAYPERLNSLRAAGVALWDVLQSCQRVGSLDTAIDKKTAEPNRFAPFFAAHPHIVAVLCNGTAAHDLFVRRVVPTCAAARPLNVQRLPSTSPAHASMTPGAKLDVWRAALEPHLRPL